MTRRNQYDALGPDQAQGSQETLRSEELESLISSKFQELLSNAGVQHVAARYDGRAGIASRRCLVASREASFLRAAAASSSSSSSSLRPLSCEMG